MSAVPNIDQGGAGYLVGCRVLPSPTRPRRRTLLVAGSGLDRHALTGLANRDLRGSTVVFGSAVLAGLASAPLQHGTYLALALGGDAAAAACLLVLLLTLLMSADSRQMTLARMSTMGLSAGQSRRLAVVESVPLVVAVVVGGLACGLALAPLVGPALRLAVFTGSGAGVPVLAEPGWLAASGRGLARPGARHARSTSAGRQPERATFLADRRLSTVRRNR